YKFEPARFTPAVFIPSQPPHPSDAAAAGTPAFTPVDPAQAPGAPASTDGDWSRPLARIGEELLAWLRTVISAAVYATLIVTFGFQVARVEGQSMIPTLEDQDRLIVNKAVYRLHDPVVG